MNVVIRMPARGAAASVNFLNSFCRKLLAKKGSSWRTIRSGGKRLSHAPISGGRGFAMASRFAAAALLALAATTMLSTSDANAQTPELGTLVVRITGTSANRLDPVFSRAVTTYNVVFSEADVADSTRLSFLTTAGTGVYALLCRDVSTRVGGSTRGDLTLVNQELPGMNASTVLRFYAITTDRVNDNTVNPSDANSNACSEVDTASAQTYVTKYTVTVTRGDPNALNSITFTPTAGATDTTTIDYVAGQTEYSAGVAAGTTAGTLSVTAAETTARFRLCNGTNEVGGGTVSTSNAITVPLDGITTTNVVTRTLIVSDDGDLVVACNANAADIQDGQDRVYTFSFAANAATGAAVRAALEGSGSPTPESTVFLEDTATGTANTNGSEFTLRITGYTARAATAAYLVALITVNPDATGVMPEVGTTFTNADDDDGAQTLGTADYTIGFDHPTGLSNARQPRFGLGSATSFRVFMPVALFQDTIGSNPAEGSENVTITVTAKNVPDGGTRFTSTAFSINEGTGTVTLAQATGISTGGERLGALGLATFADGTGGVSIRGTATFEIFAAGGLTTSRLTGITVAKDGGTPVSAADITELGSTEGGANIIMINGTTSPTARIVVAATANDAGDTVTIVGETEAGVPLMTPDGAATKVEAITSRTFTRLSGGDNRFTITVNDDGTAVDRVYTITVRTTQRDGTTSQMLSGIEPMGGPVLLNLAGTDIVEPRDFDTSGNTAYSVQLPYTNADQSITIAANVAEQSDGTIMSASFAPVRFCNTSTSTPTRIGDVGVGDTSMPITVASANTLTAPYVLTIYITAEDSTLTAPTCATAADHDDTTGYTVNIGAVPEASGGGVIGSTTPPSVAEGGFGTTFDVTLSDIPGRVYNRERLVPLTGLQVTLGTFAADNSGDTTINDFTTGDNSIGTDDFTLMAPAGVTFIKNPGTAFETEVVFSVPRSLISFTSGVDTTLTFIVNTASSVPATPQVVSINPATGVIAYLGSGSPDPSGPAGTVLTNPATGNTVFTITEDSDPPTLADPVSTLSFQQNVPLPDGGVALFTSHDSAESLTYTVAPSTPPPGLMFNLEVSPPTITGSPTQLGTTPYTLTATDTSTHSADLNFSITVNEAPPTTVTVSPVDPSINEDGGSVEVRITLNNVVRAQDVTGATGTVDVPFTIGGTAVGGTDFIIDPLPTTECDPCSTTAGTLKFGIGEDERIIVFTAVDNTAEEVTDKTIMFDLTMDMIELQSDTAATDDGTAKNMLEVEADDDTDITINNDDMAPVSVESVTANPDTIREKNSEVSTITVRLNSAAVDGGTITLNYAFSTETGMGNAVLGTDYTAECPGATPTADRGACVASGPRNLVFIAGEDTVTVNITAIPTNEESPVEGNGEDEDDEVFTFTVSLPTDNSNGTVMSLTDDSATVTIREIATEAVVVKNEIETVTTIIGATQVGTISGLIRTRITSPVSVSPPVTRSPSSPDTASALHLPDNPQDMGDMLNGLGLEHSANADGGGVYAVWARGTYTSMEGDPTVDGMKVDYDGDSTGLGIGAEKVTSKYVAGVAVNWLTTDLDLRSEENEGLSKYEESLVMIAPYLALRRGNGRSFWISAGYGFGEADGTTAEDSLTASADVNVSFLNAGADFVITMNEYGELVGSLSALGVRKTVDAFAFEGVDPISQTSLTTFRGQGEVTYYRNIGAAGGRVRPYIGLATLHDAGDKLNDDSHALDLRGGGEFRGEKINASLEVSTELLRKDHKSWTISGSARYLFSPDELGMSLTLDGAHASDSNMGVEGGYGMMVREVHKDALLTPFAGLKHGSGGNGEVSSGMRLAIGSSMDADLRAARAFGNDEDTLKLNLRQAF